MRTMAEPTGKTRLAAAEKELVRGLACAYLTMETAGGGAGRWNAAVAAVVVAVDRLPWLTDPQRAARLERVAIRAADLWGRR